MTLLIGPPGCGKTTLFKSLTNRLLGGKLSGQILFDGKPINPKNHSRNVSYVTQQDIHNPAMTLKETLMFSAECQMPEDSTQEQKIKRVECVMNLLGIRHREDVVVGDQELRGLSGGEKRRASIAIEAVKAPNFICLDEPSTGLDSQTAFEILQHVQTICKVGGVPVLCSLLQPSYELASLFDQIIILNEGDLIFFGAFQEAVSYFQSIGFSPRETENPADFLQNIVQKPHLYLSSGPSQYSSFNFKEKYLESKYYQECQSELQTLQPLPGKRTGRELNPYPTSIWKQIYLCLKREFVTKIRNPAIVKVRLLKAVFLGFILGSLYFDLGTTQSDSFNKLGLMFFLVVDTSMSSMVTIPTLLKDRTVFYEQKLSNYYQPLAYFVGLTLAEFPLAFVETIIFSSLIYWMAGFDSSFDIFLFYLFVIYVLDLTLLAFCRFCSSIAPSFALAAEVTPGTIAIFLLFGGYMLPPDSMIEAWKWLFWISPIHYAFQSLALNEFVGQTLSCSESELVPPSDFPLTFVRCPLGYNGTQVCGFQTGDDLLNFYDIDPDEDKILWVIIIIAEFGLVMVLNFLSLHYLHIEPPRTEQPIESPNEHSIETIESDEEDEEERRLLRNSAGETVAEFINRKIVGASLYFQDLSYVVPKPNAPKEDLVLLDQVSGGVKPGGMLALMGASGAGKSTLLDVLSDRKTAGRASGFININGKPREPTFKQFTGYVEQQDSHIPTQTVQEAVEFSSILRLPSTWSLGDKIEFANYVLELLDLTPLKKCLIGTPPTGISFEQRKRLTIAVELAANPTLLFLDEPTTGLDSAGAEKVMSAVKNIAESGRSIICTIHQPSKPIFMLFTDLLLLKKGGKVVYFGSMGEECLNVINYFSDLRFPYSTERNPADYILEISGSSVTSSLEENYQRSELSNENSVIISEGMKISGEEYTFPGKYATGFWLQFKMNLKRFWKGQIRRKEVIIGKLTRSLAISLLVGSLYYQQPHTQIGAQNRAALCFFGSLFSALNSVASIPIIVDDRAAYYREHSSGTYRTSTYLISMLLADLPSTILAQILWSFPVYYLAGMNPAFDKYLVWFLALLISSLCYNGLCQTCAASLPNAEVATSVSTSILTFFTIFGGFFISKGSIPDYWIWVYHISIQRYAVEAATVNELEDTDFYCTESELVKIYIPACDMYKTGCQYTNGNQLIDSYDMDTGMKYYDLLILGCYFIFLTILTQLALRYVRVIKR